MIPVAIECFDAGLLLHRMAWESMSTSRKWWCGYCTDDGSDCTRRGKSIEWQFIRISLSFQSKPTKKSDKKWTNENLGKTDIEDWRRTPRLLHFFVCLSLIDFNFKRFGQWDELTWDKSTDIRHAQLHIAHAITDASGAMICFSSHSSLCSSSLFLQRQVLYISSKLFSRKQRNI